LGVQGSDVGLNGVDVVLGIGTWLELPPTEQASAMMTTTLARRVAFLKLFILIRLGHLGWQEVEFLDGLVRLRKCQTDRRGQSTGTDFLDLLSFAQVQLWRCSKPWPVERL